MRTPNAGFRILFVLALVITTIRAGYPPMVPVLQPFQAISPGGVYLFELKPGHRFGSGPCEASLSRKETGEFVWKRRRPFTFWRACVTDDGVVGGFGYTKGPMGGDPWGEDGGDFVVRILGPDGVAMHAETTDRGSTVNGMTGYIPPPSAYSMELDNENNRMVVLMGNGTFRSYHMTRGGLGSATRMDQEGLPDRDYHLREFRVIPCSPLVLLRLPHYEEKNGRDHVGSVFALMNRDGGIVWSHNHEWILPEDWESWSNCMILSTKPEPEMDWSDDADPFVGGSADAGGNGDPVLQPVATFDLYIGDSAERVTFLVSELDGEWVVKEKARCGIVLPEVHEVLLTDSVPRLKGKRTAEFLLRGADEQALSQLAAVELGPGGRIHALESDSSVVHVLDRDGKHLHDCDPGDLALATSWSDVSLTVDDHGEVFVKMEKPSYEYRDDFDYLDAGIETKDPQDQFLRFSSEGHMLPKRLTLHRTDSSANLHAQPETMHLLLKDLISSGSRRARLIRRDRYGTQVAEISRRADGHWLDHLQGVAFAPDGSFALADSYSGNETGGFITSFPLPPSHLSDDTVTIFDSSGKPVRTFDFEFAKGFNNLAFDGTHLAATSSWGPFHPFVCVLKATGEPVGAIRIEGLPKEADKEPSLRPFIVSNGSEILLIDLTSARAFRYAIPNGPASDEERGGNFDQ